MKKWWKGWNEYWFALRPLHGLALFRIYLGLIFFLYYWFRLPYAAEMFSNEAFYVVHPFFEKFPPLPLFSPRMAQLIILGCLFSSLCFAAGIFTRFFNVILLCFVSYLSALESALAPQCHNLIFISLFLLLFAPAGRFGSLDYWLWRRRHPDQDPKLRKVGPIWIQRLIVIQLAMVYFSNSFFKLYFAEDWFTGENLRRIFLANTFGQKPLGLWIADQSWLLPYLGTGFFLFQIMLPILLLTPQYRTFAVAGGTLLHLLIHFCMRLTSIFFFTMTAHYVLVIPPERWEKLLYRLRPFFSRVRVGAGEELRAEA